MTAADHANTVRAALNIGPLPDSQSDRDKLDAGHDALDALEAQAKHGTEFVSHDGMVTVYASDGRYVGCMGNELWDWLTVHDREAIMGVFETNVAAEARVTELETALRKIVGLPLPERQKLARAALATEHTQGPTSYEFDGEGRAYARYRNGEVLPTGRTARSFAGKSDVTPERYEEITGLA